MTVSDDRGNINVKCCTSSVPDTADLPRYAPEGYVIRIATETDPEEDLWVKFDAEGVATPGNGFGQPGAWIECVAPDTKYIINQTTMPCVLEYDSVNDDFDFKYVDWADRQVGTTTSNPDPSFIGNKINDIATFQSRLVLLAGPYAVLSRTNREEDFWLGSASALVDDDAIDISSTAVEASIMQAAIPHNRDLVIFSTRGQFVIFGRNALTPTNASLVLTTAFEADLLAKPVPAGRNIFFGTTFGRFAGVREFYTEGGTDINDTRPITHHVKQFIEGRARKFTASPNYELLGVTTGTSNFYLYQYIWADNEKVQSSWSRWTLNEPIAYSFFDDEILYFVIKREATNEYFLHRMSLDVIDSAGLSFPIMLDSRFDVTGVNTSFVLPFDSLYDRGLVAVQGAGCPNPGMRVLIESISYVVEVGYVATLAADMLGGDIVVGIPYLSKYAPTMPLPKDQDGVVMSTAKLHVRHFIATVQDTGYIAGQTYTDYGNGEIVEFEGRVIGAPSNIIGAPALYNGQVTLPFREDVNNGSYVAFYSRSFYPMTLLDIEWLGQYSKRGQRMSINSKG
jgi:hypothetical protein